MKAAFYICNTPFRKYRRQTITPHTTEMLLCGSFNHRLYILLHIALYPKVVRIGAHQRIM